MLSLLSLLYMWAVSSSLCGQPEITNRKDNQWRWQKIVIVSKRAFVICPHYYQGSGSQELDKLIEGEFQEDAGNNLIVTSYPLPLNTYLIVDGSQPENFFPSSWDMSITHLFAVRLTVISFNNLVCANIDQIAIADVNRFRSMKYTDYKNVDDFRDKTVTESGNFSTVLSFQNSRGYYSYDIRAGHEGKMELFVSWQQQFVAWEWENKAKEWIETYAFSTTDSGPFRVCQIGDELYVLFREGGIYHVNVTAAKSQGKPIVRARDPENKPDMGYIWYGYESESVREKSVPAKKVGNLRAEILVVDKDSNKAYFIAEEKLFDLTNLEKSVKLPDIDPNLKGEKADAAYLQAIMNAIRSLNKPEPKQNQSESMFSLLLLVLITAFVVLAGVVIFLLLRRKK